MILNSRIGGDWREADELARVVDRKNRRLIATREPTDGGAASLVRPGDHGIPERIYSGHLPEVVDVAGPGQVQAVGQPVDRRIGRGAERLRVQPARLGEGEGISNDLSKLVDVGGAGEDVFQRRDRHLKRSNIKQPVQWRRPGGGRQGQQKRQHGAGGGTT